ncbi:hydantoinase/oxoprolinase family protein [Thiohalocapsa marina]|uniref:Hydantoinase/oxoprolinase family protein n=1 Tax=Thiohalocapsa marina TaxID=424902 RepID=A0A5M8FNM6_9GAMM|nr:hydantoinase/oxoprolinase family protein [Thiohalocapsa marina]KAA6185600.1 hydantoinase/oxoprolinase family protein [Thiohalocapsa marina]
MIRLGIDTGGTFTDFVLWQDGRMRVHKVLSTPQAPERAILQGIADLGLSLADTGTPLQVVHGSTVATNAVLEGKGARTLYVANRGLADLLAIGRQARAELYALQPQDRPPPVPAADCVETGGRLAADGTLVEPLTAADLDALGRVVAARGPEAVAINLLFSFIDDSAERAIAEALPSSLFVSRSSEVLPLLGEYERGIATWLNARLGPLVGGYIRRLQAQLPDARLSVMQSSGEAVAAGQTARQAVRLLLSGPAGGLAGAGFVGRGAGIRRLLSFDMGGTSTDVALVDGAPHLTTEGRIAGYPVAVPMVDMHTIGAGGGSIARLDAGGALLVGPESAGADPGPVCYGKGGREPTVTDANLVLGRLRAAAFLGGRMQLDLAAARDALSGLGRRMGLSAEQAALGIIDLANEHMTRALRVISVQRGLDPRDSHLCSFGGAGGLHVCALADALGMTRALVPERAGVLSALGMLVTPPGRLLTRTWLGELARRSDAEIAAALRELGDEGAAALGAEGVTAGSITREESLDLRYRGQSCTLNVPWQGGAAAADAFRRLHRERYGHDLDLPVELVNLRVRLTAPAPAVMLPEVEELESASNSEPLSEGKRPTAETTQVFGCEAPVPVLSRSALPVGAQLHGPAIVLDPVATTWLAPGWELLRDRASNLHLWRGDDPLALSDD